MSVNDFTNTLYLLKQMHSLGKLDGIRQTFGGESLFEDNESLNYDCVYPIAECCLFEVFSSNTTHWDEGNQRSYYVFKDEVISRFYTLAGQFGKQANLPDAENPFITNARLFAAKTFSFSYSLSHVLRGFTDKEKAQNSSFTAILYEDGTVDIIGLVISLVWLYQYFVKQSRIIERCLAQFQQSEADALNHLEVEQYAKYSH